MRPEKVRRTLSQIEAKINKKKKLIQNLEREVEILNNEISKINAVIAGEFLSKIQMSPMDLLNVLEKKNRILLEDSKIIINTEHKRINLSLESESDEDFQELMRFLKMHLIPPDEVHLMPDLFIEK